LSSFGQGKSYIELQILSVFIIFLLISFYEPERAEFIRSSSKKSLGFLCYSCIYELELFVENWYFVKKEMVKNAVKFNDNGNFQED